MDKWLIRKDVYDELIEKGYGKRDISKLTKKEITDKNGHRRSVYVKNEVDQTAQKQSGTKELSEEKRARYEEMLEKVKAGPDENALFVSSKGMLNKKDAIAHLEGKLGKRSGGNVAQKMAAAEDKAFAESEKDAQKKYGNMSIEELKAEAKKYDGVSKYSPEANEARKVYDILNQKLEDEKKNETPHGYILNKLTDEEKNKIYDLFKDADFTKQLDSKLEFHLDDKAGEMILKKMPHGALQSKIYELAREYNRKNFKDAREYKIGLPEKAMGQLYKEYKQKPSQDDMKENYLDAKNEGGKDIAAENKKEIDRLMKIGFDRRSAYAKVALDAITERLDVEKDKSIREKLFEDMRDVQLNGLNAKYFDTHKEEFGL